MTLETHSGGTGDTWPTHKAKARKRRASHRAGYSPRVMRLHVWSIEGLLVRRPNLHRRIHDLQAFQGR